jgi:hypothetical protein
MAAYLDRTAPDRMARYRNRQQQLGKRELRVWVTDDQAEAIRVYLASGTLQPPQGHQGASQPSQGHQGTLQPSRGVFEQPEHYAFAFRFKTKPSAEVRDRLKRNGCTYDANKHYWTAKVPQSDKDWAERYLGEIGAEIFLLEPIPKAQSST